MYMKTAKKIKVIVLATLMLLLLSSVLTACGSEETNSSETPSTSSEAPSSDQSNDPSKTETEKTTELTSIEAMMIGYGTSAIMPEEEDNFVEQKMKEDLAIDLEMVIPDTADEFEQKLNIRAAGNDLPDIIKFANKEQYTEYAKKGLLLDLTDYTDDLKAMEQIHGPSVFTKGIVDGKVYGLALKASTAQPNVLWVRQDWLDHLGLTMPEDLDGLVELAKAFTEDDPDGNGKHDTYGITGDPTYVFNFLHIMNGALPASFYNEDGEMINGFYDEDLKKGIEYIQTFVNEGIIDPELTTNTIVTAANKAFQGKAGLFVAEWSRVWKDEMTEQWQTANPNAEWALIDTLPFPQWFEDLGSTSGIYAISKDVAKDEAKLEKVLALFDYTAQGEGLDLVQFGIEGTHFTKDGDQVVITEQGMQESGFTWIYQFSGRPEESFR